jgi:hypothetical protein
MLMRIKVTYEWGLETQENGNIVDTDFSDSLSFDKNDLTENKLLLVRYEGNEIDGITDMLWAYVENNSLPECFSDSCNKHTAIKVPERFKKELINYLK